MAKRAKIFQDKRSKLFKVIKASQRLDGKPQYGLTERIQSKDKKEAQAFGDVIKLVDYHEELDNSITRFKVQ